jgi:acyl-CoA synthetase (AMP-forming)/AMP-acid ligase II
VFTSGITGSAKGVSLTHASLEFQVGATVFTSGITGSAKGVCLTHASLEFQVGATVFTSGITGFAKGVSLTPSFGRIDIHAGFGNFGVWMLPREGGKGGVVCRLPGSIKGL